MRDLAERLQAEFGADGGVRAATADDTFDGVPVEAVARPEGELVARDIVTWCGREDVAVAFRGCGSKLGLGAPPTRCRVVLDTTALNRVIEHDEGNATVTAEAGITLAALDAAVRTRGQFVPLDDDAPGGPGSLGGVVASNHSGATRLRYGTPGDLVVGLHAGLSDGRWIQAGSKVVKNVSGYDLNRVFVGSLGTLGLITRVTLRLRPQVPSIEEWFGVYDGLDEAAAAAQAIFDGPFEPSVLRLSIDNGAISLRARFEGGTDAVQAQLARLPASVAAPSCARPALWRVRATLPFARALHWVRDALAHGAIGLQWDAGAGVVRAALPGAAECLALRVAAEALQGHLIIEAAPASFITPDLVWGAPRPEQRLMESVKSKFDPRLVCAPGRMPGGV